MSIDKVEYNKNISDFIKLAFQKVQIITISEEVIIRDFFFDIKKFEFEPEKLLSRFEKITPLEQEVLESMELKEGLERAKLFLKKAIKGS